MMFVVVESTFYVLSGHCLWTRPWVFRGRILGIAVVDALGEDAHIWELESMSIVTGHIYVE